MIDKLDSEREDMMLEELFRNKLEEAEIVPDQAVYSRLMKRLTLREFVTFNPARFNAYYLGAAIFTGIAAAVLLFSGKDTATVLPDEKTSIVTSVQENNINAVNEVVKNSKDEVVPPAGSKKPSRSGINGKTARSSGNVTAERPERHEIEKTIIIPSKTTPGVINKVSDDTDRLVTGKNNTQGFIASVYEGCVPLKVRFINISQGADSSRWNFGDGGVASGIKADWIFDVDGEYKVTMESYSDGRLQATLTELITVYPRPAANFEISPEKASIPDEEVRFMNYSANAVSYKWDFGDGTTSEAFEPVHRYGKYASYDVKLKAVNEYGCADSLIIKNAFAGSKYFIEFPNAFIPNPDGPSGGYYTSKSDESAQVFHPSHSGIAEYQLKIFSKIGILIFESNDVNIGWDGYMNGQLSNYGVYIWKVRGKYRNGETFTKMGDVTLLKK